MLYGVLRQAYAPDFLVTRFRQGRIVAFCDQDIYERPDGTYQRDRCRLC